MGLIYTDDVPFHSYTSYHEFYVVNLTMSFLLIENCFFFIPQNKDNQNVIFVNRKCVYSFDTTIRMLIN